MWNNHQIEEITISIIINSFFLSLSFPLCVRILMTHPLSKSNCRMQYYCSHIVVHWIFRTFFILQNRSSMTITQKLPISPSLSPTVLLSASLSLTILVSIYWREWTVVVFQHLILWNVSFICTFVEVLVFSPFLSCFTLLMSQGKLSLS